MILSQPAAGSLSSRYFRLLDLLWDILTWAPLARYIIYKARVQLRVSGIEVKGAFHGIELMSHSSNGKQCMVRRIAALRQVFFSGKT